METETNTNTKIKTDMKAPINIAKDQKSGSAMPEKFDIKPGLLVHVKGSGQVSGSAGTQVGVVDHLEGEDFIRLDKAGSPEGKHRWIPMEWVDKVDEKCVYLNKSENEFMTGVLKAMPSAGVEEKKMAV